MPANTQTNSGDVLNTRKTDIMLGNMTFPVPPKGIRISKSAKIDQQTVPGKNGTIKMPVGYEDATIDIQFEVPNRYENGALVETAHQRYKKIYSAFKSDSPFSVPVPKKIVSPITHAMGINNVLVKKVEGSLNSQYQHYDVKMTLLEFDSVKNTLIRNALSKIASTFMASTSSVLDGLMGTQGDRTQLTGFDATHESVNGPGPAPAFVDMGAA